MLSPDLLTTASNATFDVCLAGVNVRVSAPNRLATILALTLANVPRARPGDVPDFTLSIAFNDELWQIDGSDGSRSLLPAQSAFPQLSGATVTSLVNGVAARLGLRSLRAAVVERDGRALAMIGDDWESAITLATHLHGRGWSYVGADHALIDPATGRVFAVQKLLYVNATAIAQLPVPYRRAVEASPWYVTPKGISFYAVDPSEIQTAPAWCAAADLAAVAVVDGLMADSPSLEPADAKRLLDQRFAAAGIDGSRIPVSDLRIGGISDTCDLLEHWFASIGA